MVFPLKKYNKGPKHEKKNPKNDNKAPIGPFCKVWGLFCIFLGQKKRGKFCVFLVDFFFS
jgi:hypothetical protein